MEGENEITFKTMNETRMNHLHLHLLDAHRFELAFVDGSRWKRSTSTKAQLYGRRWAYYGLILL